MGGGLGEVMDGGLGFVGEGGEEGRDGLVGGRVFGRGGSLKTGLEVGIWEGGWGGDRGSLGSFPFSFPGLNNHFAWVGVEI